MLPGQWAAELRARRRLNCDALAAATRDVKRTRHQERDAMRAAERAWESVGDMARTTCIARVLTDGVSDGAVAYLRRCGEVRRWPALTASDLHAAAADLFLSIGAADAIQLADVGAPTNVDTMWVALSWVEEWCVTKRATAQNRARGVALYTAAVLDMLEERWLQLPEAVRPPPWVVFRPRPPACGSHGGGVAGAGGMRRCVCAATSPPPRCVRRRAVVLTD